MKFKIKITKELLANSVQRCATNCILANAYGQLVPGVTVCSKWIAFFDNTVAYFPVIAKITPTKKEVRIIRQFDRNRNTSKFIGREIEVEIPENVIQYWHGDVSKAVQKLIDNPILKVADYSL